MNKLNEPYFALLTPGVAWAMDDRLNRSENSKRHLALKRRLLSTLVAQLARLHRDELPKLRGIFQVPDFRE
ncbi:MAG: hypothetical protein ACLPXB_00620 [Thiobacillaceae bacterium]